MVRVEPDTENSLDKTSAADAFQVRSVSQQRFVRRLGKLTDVTLKAVTDALAAVLNIR